MSLAHQNAWLPPGHLRPPDERRDASPSANGLSRVPSRPRSPLARSRGAPDTLQPASLISDADPTPEEDPRIAAFRERYLHSEKKIASLFCSRTERSPGESAPHTSSPPADKDAPPSDTSAQPAVPSRRPARKLDEDDYDDYDDDEEEENEVPQAPPSPKPTSASSAGDSKVSLSLSSKAAQTQTSSSESLKEGKKGESLEDIRKKLEQDKKATEEAAKRSFHTMFYTLENDRDAMLDQQRLEESERQVEAEMSGQGGANNTATSAPGPSYGSLSSANLGASSLTLKNLIARIDMKRHEVQASDAELRSLMSEVRKNRSKWASEDKIGQEELYEAAEKVLSELKAMTEHSSPFLTRVNKREAPDYYNIIKRPMDLGTMTKKLKGLQYKSKQEFVDDLNLIWSNCLKYNTNPDHFLRKHAIYMRKETEKLVPLIPDIVIRDRAEVEAEERRLQLAELDGGEESDDEPIMSSRGRKAPGTKSKKGVGSGRKAPGTVSEATPAAESRSQEAPRPSQDVPAEGAQNGTTTPPGTLTPVASNSQGPPAGGQPDALETDGFGPPTVITYSSALSGLGSEFEDPEYKVWKQVTKRDRARVTAERHRLFKGNRLNADEPALLRTKAGMRRWLKNQKQATEGDQNATAGYQGKDPESSGETLAEGIEEEEDRILPDYYDPMSGIPDIPEQLHWTEDSEGNVVNVSDEYLRILPKGSFTAPPSKFAKRMDANMRQMQETRKVCNKINIVRQMQQQSQMYQNQFQRYQPEPFVEQDVPTHVMNDDGPVISPWVCRAALQRSVGKILYHAGFEEYQPSAMDAITDVAADFFHKIGVTLKSYMEAPKVPVNPDEESLPSSSTANLPNSSSPSSSTTKWKSPYTCEEMILHTLQSVGTDVEALEAYVKDDIERTGQKLGVIHDRLKSHLAELLRPAFNDSGDGSQAFEDGSEQFIGGDFAEDIDEDFFGFKELGLDKEFGLASLSVPLHLLQNRMYHAHQAQNTNAAQATSALFPTPPPYPRITLESIPSQIGLVQNFFLEKLNANNNEPLVEDLELPPKQRPTAARPRVPASGKIPPQPLPNNPSNNTNNNPSNPSNNSNNAPPPSATSSAPLVTPPTTTATTNTTSSTGATNGQVGPQSSPLKRPAPATKRDKLHNVNVKQPRLI
ncbi:hypothetical protein VTO42DRAFT_5373 [Malbranchea cinnamomea]